jgi:Cu/Ag efflux protein CusF
MFLADESESRYEALIKLAEEVTRSTDMEQPTYFVELPVITLGAEDPPTYIDLVAIVDGIETGRRRPVEEIRAQRQVPQPPEHLIVSGMEQARHAVPITESITHEEEEIKKDLETIKKEIKSVSPKLKEVRLRHVKVKNLVLPSLSLSDQIAELQRIMEGINEGIFDKEHMEIVLEEVFGLYQVVEKAKKSLKKRNVQTGSLEQSLWALRDQRLNETIELLRRRGVA